MPTASATIQGDLNGDGVVDEQDATLQVGTMPDWQIRTQPTDQDLAAVAFGFDVVGVIAGGFAAALVVGAGVTLGPLLVGAAVGMLVARVAFAVLKPIGLAVLQLVDLAAKAITNTVGLPLQQSRLIVFAALLYLGWRYYRGR